MNLVLAALDFGTKTNNARAAGLVNSSLFATHSHLPWKRTLGGRREGVRVKTFSFLGPKSRLDGWTSTAFSLNVEGLIFNI